jgi:DNA ligase 1
MRARLGIGALLVGVYHTQKDLFQTIAKIGSGLSAGEWVRVRERLDEIRVLNRSPRVDSQITPDVWVEPTYVITVIADEITRSPRHTCGRDEGGAGLALRFPRALGFIRDDKSPEDATTVEEIQEMYAMQL